MNIVKGAMRGILFDKDGTLLDFEASWSAVYRELCVDLAGGNLETAEAMLIAGGLDPVTRRFKSGATLAAGTTVDIVKVWYPEFSDDEERAMVERIDRVFHDNGIRCSVPVPGLATTLAALESAGLAMGVATNDGTAATRAALTALGIENYLPHGYGYDSVAHPKPAPDIVHAFCEAIRAKPHDIVVVGDNPHDLEMAHRAGAGAAIGVLTGNSGRDDLAPLADAVLASVAELPGWLRTREAR
jgi:phosphoglycolate phosphatase